MDDTETGVRRRILGVFAHPDDETSSAAGTFARYVEEGVDVYVATATRGEQGDLDAGHTSIAREDLPAVRESELRSVLEMYGAHPPFLLGYRDQEVIEAEFGELVEKVMAIINSVNPDVIVTFGPTGISHHDDHIAVHRATVEAFHRFRKMSDRQPRLFYVALPPHVAAQFELEIDGPEVEPTHFVDIGEYQAIKLKGLRMYRSQRDAQELADRFEDYGLHVEAYHQAYPPVADGDTATGFWD